MTPILLVTKSEKDYELLDSGEGEKLERYGRFVISRPDPQAIWKKSLPEGSWNDVAAAFSRNSSEDAGWNIRSGTPEKWNIELAGLSFIIKPTSFKHTGIFPEQVSNWKYIEETITDALSQKKKEKVSVLNLFGYTGGASLAAAKAGASVVHVDGSKAAITWAKENASLSGLSEKPIRWILDDARTFLKREVKRGNTYDVVIMDPPAFGRGPKGEVWKIEDHLLELFDLVKKVLSDNPLALIVNGYASGYSAIGYYNALADVTKKYKGTLEAGEMTIQETSGRLLPAGIVARWKSL